MLSSARSGFAHGAGKNLHDPGKRGVKRVRTKKTLGRGWKGERDVDRSSYEKMTTKKLVDTVCFLKEQNQKLGATLLRAMRDMAKLDACEICAYGQTDKCTAPKEVKLGGSCFCWRGKEG